MRQYRPAAHPARWHRLGLGCVIGSRLLDGAMLWLCGLLLDLVLVPFSVGAFGPLLVAYVLLVSVRGLLAFGDLALDARGGALGRRVIGRILPRRAANLAALERAMPTALRDIGTAGLRCLVFFAMLGLLHWQLALLALLVVVGFWWSPRQLDRPGLARVGALTRALARGKNVAGIALIALLGVALLLQGRLSPGGLLLTLAAAAQIALLLQRIDGMAGPWRNAASSGGRRALVPPAHASDWGTLRWSVGPVSAEVPARGESLLLVGLPLALLLIFLLSGIAGASDIRPTLAFPGLRISRPAPAPAAQRTVSSQPSGTPTSTDRDTLIWQATVGPLRATPTLRAVVPQAATVELSPTPIAATATADIAPTPGRAVPTATPPATSTIAIVAPTRIASAEPSPTATLAPTAPPPTATRPPVATVPPPPFPTVIPPLVPTPTPTPRPPASAPASGTAPGQLAPAPSASGEPQPSPSPTEDDGGGKGKPSASPSSGVSPRPSSSASNDPSPQPDASPSPADNGGNQGSSSPSPSPGPQPTASPSQSAAPSPSDNNHGPSSPQPSPSAPPQPSASPPPPTPTPKPNGAGGDDPAPAPAPSPKPSRSP